MIITIAIILILLWGLGLITGSVLGGYIHALLLLAFIMVMIRLIQGRRAL